MSNLIPEQRVDNNGVINTKHVRATPKTADSTAALPAPKLPTNIYKTRPSPAPSQKQRERRTYSFSMSLHPADSKLTGLLGIKSTGNYLFESNDSDIYDLANRMSTGNALAMLEAGVAFPSKGVKLLKDYGLEHLLIRRNFVAEAKKRRIPAGKFIQFTSAHPDEEMASDPLVMDALETSCLSTLEDNYAWEVREGTIRLDDIKAVGAGRIRRSAAWKDVGAALTQLASGEANYSRDELISILDKHSPRSSEIRDALLLAKYHGGEFVLSLDVVNEDIVTLHYDLADKSDDVARNRSILTYAATVNAGWRKMYGWRKQWPDEETIIRFYDANVSAQDFFEERVTVHQLDAIQVHGISPSVSGGWL